MANYFYTDANGQKQGPVNDQLLRELVGQGKILPTTLMETEGGHTGAAGQIPGLFPATSSTVSVPPIVTSKQVFCTNCGQPVSEQAVACMSCGAKPTGHKKFCRQCGTGCSPEQVICTKCGSKTGGKTRAPVVPSTSQQAFCTNCGSAISGQAVACMSCGAKPVGHRKFCRQCGTALNPEQVICTHCGSGVRSQGLTRFVSGDATAEPKSKLVAGLLAILLGGLGVHKFYMGSWGWGTIYLVNLFVFLPIASFLSLFVIGVPLLILSGTFATVVSIISLVEGILYLTMSDESFAAKYPPETQGPFRW